MFNPEELKKEIEEIQKAKEELQNPQPVEEPVQPQVVQEQPVEAVQEQDPEPVKKITVTYGGEEITLDDPDGYLGRGSAEGIKKAYANLTPHLSKVEQENREYRQRLAELEAKLNKDPEPVHAPVVEQVATQEQVNTAESLDLNLPSNPLDWTEENVNTLNSALSRINEYQDKIKKFETIQEKYEREEQERQARLRQEQLQNEEKAFWDSYNSFAEKTYEIKDMRAKTDEVVAFMDNVAFANGCTPEKYGNNRALYEQERSDLTQSFLDNDPLVANKCAHIQKPSKLDEYYKAAAVNNTRQQLIKEGILTEKASIEQAFLLDQQRQGNLEQSFSSTAEQRYTAGLKTKQNNLVNAIDQQADYAKPIETTQSEAQVDPGFDLDEMYKKVQQNPFDMGLLNEFNKKRNELLSS